MTTIKPHALLTLLEIADLTGRDLKTIKTWRANNRWPNAVQDPDGRRAWRIPVADLIAAGDLRPEQVEQVHDELAARRESRHLREAREQVIRLEERVAALQALADERASFIATLTKRARGGVA